MRRNIREYERVEKNTEENYQTELVQNEASDPNSIPVATNKYKELIYLLGNVSSIKASRVIPFQHAHIPGRSPLQAPPLPRPACCRFKSCSESNFSPACQSCTMITCPPHLIHVITSGMWFGHCDDLATCLTASICWRNQGALTGFRMRRVLCRTWAPMTPGHHLNCFGSKTIFFSVDNPSENDFFFS